MTAPRWAVALLSWLALPGEEDDVLGDLEEAHRGRLIRHTWWVASLRTSMDALDMSAAVLRERFRRRLTGELSSRMSSAMPGASWLDVKLALRMLFNQPGLTVVAIFALAIGIPVGLLPLHVLHSLTTPLPVEAGEEIVMVRNYDRASSDPVSRPLHDFVQWREQLSSFEDLGMWRSDLYNVNSEDGRATPVRGAEVTASTFSLLRVRPMIGRMLSKEDEVIGAPDVVVIGHDLWQSRLAGNPNVVGSTIRIGAVPHTVVGVMPEDFLFPERDHLWLPFRYDVLAYERGQGPNAVIVGRLAKGVSIEEARTEIEFFGQRMATQFPSSHAQLVPQVLPYTHALMQMDTPDARLWIVFTQILALLLLALACGNVGILILARAATRTRELAIRTALGASRIRILSQLFIESLVLAATAAGAGLLLLQVVARGPDSLLDQLPFWVDFDVSLRTTLLAMSLAVLSAAIAGVVPALKATGKRVQASMHRASGDSSGIRFGKGYSLLIVGEVAISLWLLAIGSSLLPAADAKPGAVGIQSDQYLFAALRIPRVGQETDAGRSDRPDYARKVAAAHQELIRRLSLEPGLGPVAIGNPLPGMSHNSRWVQIEGLPREPGAPAPAYAVNVARVDIGYFDALKQPILHGRNFNNADLGGDRSAVIVNQSFVDRVLGGRNPLGQRVRYWEAGKEPGPWSLEIVGVVPSLGMNAVKPETDEGMYHLVAPGELHPVTFAVRVGNDPERFTTRLRSIVSAIDASALIQSPMALNEVPDSNRRIMIMSTYILALLAGIAVILSAACLYALMAFTVAERTRECGIRTALGAQPTNIVSTVATRAFLQLAAGVSIGAGLSALTLWGFSDYNSVLRTTDWPLKVGVITLFVIVVGMLACVRPTLRAIRIRPMEALKG